MNYLWVSLDPARCEINIYPGSISRKIENDLQNQKDKCVLGADFFNATIHLKDSSFYQTTPSVHMGRSGFKAPGYRNVQRIIIEDNENTIKLYGKKIHGEWRMVNEYNAEKTFIQTINECDINKIDNENSNLINSKILHWTPNDLLSNSNDNNYVIVWQWCQKTHNNVLNCSDAYWVPYNNDINSLLENNFNSLNLENNSYLSVNIDLPLIGERKIELTKNTCYGRQVSLDNSKVRRIRRVIKTIKDVKKMFEDMIIIPDNYLEIINNLNPNEIPHDFYCPILQEIMINPVLTVDGFTYERSGIEKWLAIKSTSPLTGLPLSSRKLTDNTELKEIIIEFIKDKNMIM